MAYQKITGEIMLDAPPLSDYVDQRSLAAGVAETVTVPAWANVVLFSSTGNFAVRADGSAAVYPAADKTDGTGSALNPTIRRVNPSGTFSIIADATCQVTMEWFQKGG